MAPAILLAYLDSGQRKTVIMEGSSCVVYKCVQIHNNNTVQHNSILACIIHNEIIDANYSQAQVCFHCGFLSAEAIQLSELAKVAFYPIVSSQPTGGTISWLIWTLPAEGDSQAKSVCWSNGSYLLHPGGQFP